MKYITKEVRIGIAGIVALCVLIYGINWLKGIHMFQPSSYFYAKFEKVSVFSERKIRKIQIQKYCLLYLIIKGNG